MHLLGIDPGPKQSGWVEFLGAGVWRCGIDDNNDIISTVMDRASECDALAIEKVSSYGMAVGADVFETCVWIGRFLQAWHHPDDVMLIPRFDVKMALCHSTRARDANVRQALIDRFGPGKEKAIGRKKSPGPLYSVKGHAWSALAVAVVAEEKLKAQSKEAA